MEEARVQCEKVAGGALRVIAQEVRFGGQPVPGHGELPAIVEFMPDIGEQVGVALVHVVPVANQCRLARHRVERTVGPRRQAGPVIALVAVLLKSVFSLPACCWKSSELV
ncbi:hypothetical protein G6F57_022909 [Rhizopus arrhizus]|nr:hypothetical protein G6F57_022909 [Rhizopus arrhizus]